MDLEQFKNATLARSYGNPGTGTYKGECVSYARKYMEEVLGIQTYPSGNARDYWDNKISLDNFDKVADPQDGDIVVYGAVSDNPYGHIGIWYKGQLLSQNYNIAKHVTLASPNLIKNRLGYLRKKGNDVKISNNNEATYLTRLGTLVQPRDDSFTKTLVGLDLTEAIKKIEALGERRTATERFNAYDSLQARIKELESNPGSEAGEKLKKIKEILG